MINLKLIFKQIYFFMILSEVIILIATGIIYFLKADKVTEKVLDQKRVLNIISRDSYIEYIAKKLRIILEDELFILKTYLNIKDWKMDNITIENETLINAYEENNTGTWYLDELNSTEYLKGQYYNFNDSTCNPKDLSHFQKLSEFLRKLFGKYYKWKYKKYVDIEYLYLTLNTGCFFKFPSFKSDWAQPDYIPNDDKTICKNREEKNEYFSPFNDSNAYDPRCRNFYSTSIRSNETKITFTSPYKFTNGKWLSDICVRTELLTGDFSAPDVVLCMVINYFDFDVFREPKDEGNDETEIMVIHYKNNSNLTFQNLNILYDSYYFVSELSCLQNETEDENCSPINFFDVYYKTILDKIYENSKDDYKNKYLSLKNNISYLNLEDYIIKVVSNKTQYLLNITIENFNAENGYYNQTLSAEYRHGEIIYSDLDEKIYVFPILSSFDYNNTINEFKIIDGSSEQSEFFLLIREKSNSKNDEKMRFLRVAITEIFLFLFYLLSFNTLIWFAFNFIYYYIIKGLTYSLKQIRKLYLLILLKVTNTNDDLELDSKNNKLLNELGINMYNNSNDDQNNNDEREDKTILNYINDFINEYIIKAIHNLSQIEYHKEIQQSFTTLKAIMIILLYDNNNSKSKNNNNFSNFNKENKSVLGNENNGLLNNNINIYKKRHENNPESQFTNVIKYFSEIFYSSNSNKLRIDFSLVKMIIENIFLSMLREFNELKQEFIENPNKIYDNLYKKLNQIDDYFMLTKQAITNSHNELVIKNSNNRNNEDKRSDLLLLSLLEENLNYLYCIHKCLLLDELLADKINENINVGENIDEEENALLEKLQKKEKKLGKNKMKEKKQKNDDNNKDDLIFNKDDKLKFNFTSIKLNEDFTCNEESKIYIQAIIKYCEDYLEIKDINKKNMKKMNKNNNQNNLFSSTMNNVTLKTYDPYIKYNRVDELLSEFKVIFILMEISLYHILCDEAQKSFTCYENALNKFHEFEKIIEKYKNKNKSEWKLTNFTMFFINSIFYEKILVIFSFLCHKFAQYRTELFINLNILDFSPLYSLTTRKLIITKIMHYIYNLRKYLVLKANDSIASYKSLVINHNYIDIQRSIYKLICLRNIVSKEVKKRVLFLFDLDNKYIKDTVFKEIMFSYFKNYEEEIKSNNFDFYFSAFDTKLHLQIEPNFSEEVIMGRKYVKNYLVVINKYNNINLNSNKISVYDNNENTNNPLSNNSSSNNLPMLNANNSSSYKKNTINDNSTAAIDKMEDFFKFIKNYKGDKHHDDNSKEHPHRADKALYHAALFGFEKDNNQSNINKIFKKKSHSKYNTSYLILMTNLSSTFTNNQYNWKEMAELIYDKKITVVVVISYDPSFDNNDILKEKISYYKNFLKTNMIDGHLFIMRSLTLLKFILNAIFPIKFSKFNIDILRHFLCSNEDINLSRANNK